MIFWLRTHLAARFAGVLVACLAVISLFGDAQVPVPTLFTGVGGVAVAAVLPLLAAGYAAYSWSAGLAELETVAARPAGLITRVYLCAAAVATLAAAAVLSALGVHSLILTSARDLIGYLGLALLGQRLLGLHGAAVAPASYLFPVLLIGVPSTHDVWWGWPLAAPDHLLSWTVAVALFAVGLTVARLPVADRAAGS